jgi:UPF0716 protein FxsA
MGIFAAVALAELALFLVVQSWIGLGPTLLIALATAVLGSALVRRAGLRVLGELRQTLEAGQVPTRQLTHGGAVLVSGALLISPGFITDAIGFALLVPGVRDSLHRRLSRRFERRFAGSGRVDVIDVEGWEEPGDVEIGDRRR